MNMIRATMKQIDFLCLLVSILTITSSFSFNFNPLPAITSKSTLSKFSFQKISQSTIYMSEAGGQQESVVGNIESTDPYPRAGDIVTFDGKWKDEISIGKIRNLQYIESRNQWIADVLPLKDIGENIYSAKRGSGTEVFDVADLKPVRNFYVRSSDGYKVIFTKEKIPAVFSDKYRLDGFELPKPKVDSVVWQQTAQEYEELKNRLLKDTAIFGAVGAAIATGVQGAEDGLIFALGVATSLLYVVLLGKKADSVGRPSSVDDQLGNSRFFLPFLLIGVLALKHAVFHDYETQSFLQTVPKDQFGAAILGFLSYRIPLLFREISSAADGDELLSLMPGSIGQAAKLAKDQKNAPKPKAIAKEVPVVLVSGPKLLGRTQLVSRFIQQDSRFFTPTWVTDRPADDSSFNFVQSEEFQKLEESGAFMSTYEEGGYNYGLRGDDLKDATAEGKVCILDASPSLVRSALKVEGISIIAIWVSLDTLDAIEARISNSLQGLQEELGDRFSTRFQTEVDGAIKDIEFAVKSGLFEFTIINDDEDKALNKLKEAAEYSFRITS
mmetsp:Transcript_34922/g.44543  ORF Transcript_34922/g.44543 Transcript_34922/m.44543 type:complete len:554 (-) Transcript_34922:290-1951(-)